jgi:curved DNA-binding protein CbpA
MREEMTLEEARRALGVSAKAGPNDVRRAFKRLALRHHPDRNSGDAGAEAQFKRICLAHEILTGKRAPALEGWADEPVHGGSAATGSARSASGQAFAWSVRAPWETEPLRVQTSLDGEPIHYPTPEEIAALDVPPKIDGDRVGRYAVGGFVVFVLVVWAASQLAPEAHDSTPNRKLISFFGHRWF